MSEQTKTDCLIEVMCVKESWPESQVARNFRSCHLKGSLSFYPAFPSRKVARQQQTQDEKEERVKGKD